ERMGDVLHDGAFMARGAGEAPPANGGDAGLALRVVSGPDAGTVWNLTPGTYSLGRGDEVDLSLRRDLQVSRHHAYVTVFEDAVSVRESATAKNGVLVDGSRVGEATIGRGKLFQLGESVLSWTSDDTNGDRASVIADGKGELTFNRPPRIPGATQAETVTFPGVHPERQKSPFPLVGVLAPVAIGVLMALLLKRPEFLLFTLLSPIMAVSNFFSSNRRGKGSYKAQKTAYDSSLKSARDKISRTVTRQEAAFREDFPDPGTVAEIARQPGSRLWERRAGNDDFLSLRFGLARRRAEVMVAGKPPADVDLDPMLDLVPETMDLRAVGVLGIAGPRASCEGLARWLVAQAATFHAPADLSITVLSGASQEEAWSWARWLPHVRPDGARCTAQIGSTDATAALLASELAELLEGRLHAEAARLLGRTEQAHLVVLDGAYRLGSIPAVARLLRNGPGVGISFICIDDSEHLLPEECQASAVFSAEEPTRLELRVSRAAPTTSVLADL
ncbi:MAG TPA: FHA domain-containing protein, partial [Acidimicrobiales bacterium]|nr:FHA domain-containing protein [Acidimicrobiales bacterium]